MTRVTLESIIGFYTLIALIPVCAVLIAKFPSHWNRVFAWYLGMMMGLIDLAAKEAQVSVVLLFSFGMFLGFVEKKRPWVPAVLLGIWIPLAHLVSYVTGGPEQFLTEGLGSAIAILPSLAGCYVGRILRRRASGEGEQMTLKEKTLDSPPNRRASR